ncbi:MAG: DNA photolyase family protein [Maribacter sp.]|nr:DNA photolyase family protein [Maribacter sp.]
MVKKITIFWFRRDLRFDDNVGLLAALQGTYPVLPIFIFDPEILDKLPVQDARVTFIHETLKTMQGRLQENFDGTIALYHRKPVHVFEALSKNFDIQGVYTNRDYEPYARKRDDEIQNWLSSRGIPFNTFKDQVIFEKNEVVKGDGDPYVVYTPYKNRWKELFHPEDHVSLYATDKVLQNVLKNVGLPDLSLKDIGFEPATLKVPAYKITPDLINNYERTRNFPGVVDGTSRLGPHLRFGTVSVRKIMKLAISEKNEIFWNELIWREFFMQILWHFPETVTNAFKPKYDRIAWRNNEEEFEKWKNGNTGYELVDAGMRELNATGYMHNRVRMLTASFLCKHLLIDWRWGEAYFAEKLLDYELSSNIGNWQWAAGSGVDAAPYFRIFNPMTQVEKFDAKKDYISKWIPELDKVDYPEKMVDHKLARERCLEVYKKAVG